MNKFKKRSATRICANEPYQDGKITRMTKKTMVLNEALLAEAKAACGAATDTATVHQGLHALVRAAARRRMQALLGTLNERGPLDVPRRRAPATPTRARGRRNRRAR